jgi:hypothetical protein
MKVYKQILATFMIVSIMVMTGCEYDGPTAMYYQKSAQTTPPVITKLKPDKAATAGINYITIDGENFSEVADKNKVYIDGYQAEIVNHSDTSIRIRRPNRSGDSLSVKVTVFGAIEIAEYGPYKIDPVFTPYGKFLSSVELGATVVDRNENVYIFENNTPNRYIYKITPDGERTLFGSNPILSMVYDAIVGPNGNLIIFMKQREIYHLDLASGADTIAVWATVAKRVSLGDFDSFGNLYTTGARRTDITVVKPDFSSRLLGLYASDEILWLRVYENFIYALVDITTPDELNPKLAIWRHIILDSDGNLSDRELVLDWSKSGEFAESKPITFTFSDDGNIYIGTDHVHPIMFLDPDDGKKDVVYKGILPSSAANIVWGNGNYLYMILGRPNWNLIRIDMGSLDNRDFGG